MNKITRRELGPLAIGVATAVTSITREAPGSASETDSDGWLVCEDESGQFFLKSGQHTIPHGGFSTADWKPGDWLSTIRRTTNRQWETWTEMLLGESASPVGSKQSWSVEMTDEMGSLAEAKLAAARHASALRDQFQRDKERFDTCQAKVRDRGWDWSLFENEVDEIVHLSSRRKPWDTIRDDSSDGLLTEEGDWYASVTQHADGQFSWLVHIYGHRTKSGRATYLGKAYEEAESVIASMP